MNRTGDSKPTRPKSDPDTAELLRQVNEGDRSALELLFTKHVSSLRRWARGRLPAWARGTTETADLVQDALLQVFRRVDRFESRGKGALEAYLRQSIQNRIRDELRARARHPLEELPAIDPVDPQPSPFEATATAEDRERYLRALDRLRESDRELVVGAVELGYTYEQLALVAHKPSADAARVAVRRALTRLADEMTRV